MISFLKQVVSVLDAEHKRKLFTLIPLTMLLGIVQMIGVAIIFPFMSAVLQPKTIQTSIKFQYVYHSLHFTSVRSFLIFLGVVALVFLVSGNLFNILMVKKQYRFSSSCRQKISSRIYEKFMFAPYAFFLGANSSELASILTKEIYNYCCHVLLPIIVIISNVFSIAFIFILLLVINPVVSIGSVTLMSSVFAFIYIFARKKLTVIEKQRYKDQIDENKTVLETLSNVSELKILGVERFFINKYNRIVTRDSTHTATAQILSAIPRYILEIAIFGLTICAVLLMLIESSGITKMMASLAVFAFAGYRIMPLVQVIYNSVVLIKTNRESVSILTEKLEILSDNIVRHNGNQTNKINMMRGIHFKNVGFEYKAGSKKVFNHLNLEIRADQFTAIVGPSGAGKSTLICLVMGLLSPTNGEILIDGTPLNRQSVRAWHKLLGYVSQDVCLYDNTILNNIALGVDDNDINRAQLVKACKMASIHDFILTLPEGYDTKVGDKGCMLSGGQKQRIAIARALYQEPKVIVFDEATSALDNTTENEIISDICHLTSMGITVILITHKLELTKKCDFVIRVESGRVESTAVKDPIVQV